MACRQPRRTTGEWARVPTTSRARGPPAVPAGSRAGRFQTEIHSTILRFTRRRPAIVELGHWGRPGPERERLHADDGLRHTAFPSFRRAFARLPFSRAFVLLNLPFSRAFARLHELLVSANPLHLPPPPWGA